MEYSIESNKIRTNYTYCKHITLNVVFIPYGNKTIINLVSYSNNVMWL